MKEASHERTHIGWCQLYEMSRIGKSIKEVVSGFLEPGLGGNVEGGVLIDMWFLLCGDKNVLHGNKNLKIFMPFLVRDKYNRRINKSFQVHCIRI